MSWFNDFQSKRFDVNGVHIHARLGGNSQRPALVLIHGFPQSHVMWHRVAQFLRHDFYLILPDLRGYGDSTKLPASLDHAQASKRVMAQDIAQLLDQLGIDSAFFCGHDRGGRVAHRLALDHPSRVRKLCLLDIAPTLDMYAATNMAFASAYYHWFHLIQPAPLPERMILGDWRVYLHTKLAGWGGSGLSFIESQALAEYERHFQMPETIAAMCEDYRASAGIDLEHDRESRQRGDKIDVPTMIQWGHRGVVQCLFDPLKLWQAQCAHEVQGLAVQSGHFIPEEIPESTAQALKIFFLTS